MIDLPADLELGPKMQACSERERRFVWAYAMAAVDRKPDQSQAARDAGYEDNETGAIRVRGHALMHRQRVLDALDEVGRLHFRALLIPAVRKVRTMLEKDDDPDAIKTALSVLSRLGLAERSGIDVNVSGEVTHNHTDAALNDLRSLLALGVPRAELERTFGVSGLQRYERMLAEKDGKRVLPMIEGVATEVRDG